MDIFWTFYLNHLSPLWGYFLNGMDVEDVEDVSKYMYTVF